MFTQSVTGFLGRPSGIPIGFYASVSIGVEALCRAAGVSKRSMYQLFTSKDEVLAASLERRVPEVAEQLAEAEFLARQLMLVYDGASARAGTPGSKR